MNTKCISFLLLVIATFFWSGNYVVGRIYSHEIPPFSLCFWRWLIAGLILFPFTIKSAITYRHIIYKNLKIIIFLSITGITLYNSLIYFALHYTGVGNTGLIISLLPTSTLIFSFIIDKEKIFKNQIWGLLASFLGVIVLITKGKIQQIFFGNINIGNLFLLLAVIAWSLYTVLLKKITDKIPKTTLLFVVIICGIFFLFPLYMIELVHFGSFQLTTNTFISLFYISFFCSIVAFLCWNTGVAKVGAVIAGFFFYLIPFFSIILGKIFFHEKLYISYIFGWALLFFGFYFGCLKKITKDQYDLPPQVLPLLELDS